MGKYFNVEGACNPKEHYMVNLDKRILEIEKLVAHKKYFTIQKGRQYGKTTILNCLKDKLSSTYSVFYISFEGIAEESYKNEASFCQIFAGLLYDTIYYREVDGISEECKSALEKMSRLQESNGVFRTLSNLISDICSTAQKPVVLIIDEVDQAGGYPVFLTFLGMLRNKYLKRGQRAMFHSVILSGVYDIQNLKLKMNSEIETQRNSPWNIAAKFTVDMNFTKLEIEEMLLEYEQDNQTHMDFSLISSLIYEYTLGYPYLVSAICKIMDEDLISGDLFQTGTDAWTKDGFLEAVKILLSEKNSLFDSLVNKLYDYPSLKKMIYAILFSGEQITFHLDDKVIDIAFMFGFVKNESGNMAIANRIFEMRLYNMFLAEEELNSKLYSVGTMDKNQFVQNGILNMDLVMQKFMLHWNDLYSSEDEKFIENNGRKFFLLYLKPIINGTGNYYVEAQTRNNRRTDIVVDYNGRRYIIEVKIWHGNEYNRRGELQLSDYLEAYHMKRGYLLSFNFNKQKKVEMKEVKCGNKEILEVVV